MQEQFSHTASGAGDGRGRFGSDAQATAMQHVHSSYIWLGSLRVLGALLVIIIVGFAENIADVYELIGSGRLEPSSVGIVLAILAVAIIVLFALALGAQAWSYKHLYYEIGDEEFSLHKGIFTKKRMHVPYQRVQSVNHKATLLQRLIGVCTVKIETAGGASNEGITVPYLTKEAAETLRRELFARKQAILSGATVRSGTPAQAGAAPDAMPQGGNVLDDVSTSLEDARGIWGGEAVRTGHVSYEYRLTNKELVLSALTNNASFGLAIIALLGTGIPLASGLFGSFVSSAVDSTLALGFGFAAIVLALMVLGVIVVVWLISLGATVLAYGGFRAVRRDKRIEVEYGMLSRSFHGIDVDRVQSVIVKQGFFRRLFGYCELSLGRIDSAQAKQEADGNVSLNLGMVVHPFVKLEHVPQILGGLVPEFSDIPEQDIPVAPVALRRALVRNCTWGGFGFWLLVATLVTHVVFLSASPDVAGPLSPAFLAAYVLSGACIVLGAISAVLWYRRSAFAYNSHFLRVVNGGFSVKSVTVPRKKIQFGVVATNPLQRASRVATIYVRTAAGTGTDVKLLDIAAADAAAWFAWAHPHGNVRP